MTGIDANLPVAEVVVFEDRAHVIRRGLVQFDEGRNVLRLEALAGTLRDRTMRVAVIGPVQVRSTFIQRASAQGSLVAAAEVVVDAAGSGPHPVQIDYLVANATWRPRHRAELSQSQEEATVRFETEAVVWQHTNEDWRDVAIVLATDEVGVPARPPRLPSDWLDVQPKDGLPGTAPTNVAQRLIAEAYDGALMPRDEGWPRRFEAPERVTVRSDGAPHVVSIGSYEEVADLRVVWDASRASSPRVLTVLPNAATYPLLAGPVELVRDRGTYAGSQIGFIPSGEDFLLDWGSDPAIRVSRETETLPSQTRVMSSIVRTPHRVRIYISNLSTEKRPVRVEEQLPRGEGLRVIYNPDASTGSVTPDPQGRILWALDLEPNSRTTIEARYTVEQRTASSSG